MPRWRLKVFQVCWCGIAEGRLASPTDQGGTFSPQVVLGGRSVFPRPRSRKVRPIDGLTLGEPGRNLGASRCGHETLYGFSV